MENPALHLRRGRIGHLASEPNPRRALSRRALLRAGGQITLAGALSGLLLPAAATLDRAAAALPVREVAEGIFVRFGLQEALTADNCGAIANIGFIVGGTSVAVVDTGCSHQQGDQGSFQ